MNSNDVSHVDVGTLFEAARLKTALDSTSRSHLETCDFCRNTLNWMQTAAGLGPQEFANEPPQAALDGVLQLVRAPGYLKRLQNFVLATLTFDSFRNPAVAGVRSTESNARETTFEAGEIEITVSLRRSDKKKYILTGQILPKNGSPIGNPNASIELIAGGDHMSTSPLSPWGEFTFTDLIEAEYSLQANLADRLIRTPVLPLP